MVTDPALAASIVRSKEVDKFRFMYHFMDEVSLQHGSRRSSTLTGCRTMIATAIFASL